MQAGVGLLETNMMPIFHNHCLRYRHNFALFYQLLDSNLFTHRMFSFKREAFSETSGPRVYFPSYIFRSINQKPKNTLLQFIYFYFVLCFSSLFIYISVRSHPCKWPWRDWQPLYRVGCKCLIVCEGIGDLCVLILLDWYLGSLTEGNTYLYFAASPSPIQGKNQRRLNK